jgi:osmotically-inducible protein OsmY
MATRLLILLFLCAQVAGCVTLASGAASETAYVTSQERSVSDASADARIRLTVSQKLLQTSTQLFTQVDITVVEGRVLLTGNVMHAADRVKAVQLVWQVPGVRQVQNELKIHNGTGVGGYAHDSWIIAKLRTRMILEKHVLSINYNIDCVNGVVYLMGIAQDPDELGRVMHLARDTAGVTDVVSYVRLKTDLPNPILPPAKTDHKT